MKNTKYILLVIMVLVTSGFISWAEENTQVNEEIDQEEVQNEQVQNSLPDIYPGVIPGTNHPPPAVERLVHKNGRYVTWPGFQLLSNNGSRIFLQTTYSPQFETQITGSQIIVKLRNSKIYLHTNRYPLLTQHFSTPVQSARLLQSRKNVDLIIDLKRSVQPNIYSEPGSNGFYFLFVEFPPE